MWWFLLFACADKPDKTSQSTSDSCEQVASEFPSETVSDGPEDAYRFLRRLSLDLRGIPPSEEELSQIASNPNAWKSLRDQYMEGPRFTERLVHLYAESWHTRVDVFDIIAFDYGLDASEEYTYERSVGE